MRQMSKTQAWQKKIDSNKMYSKTTLYWWCTLQAPWRFVAMVGVGIPGNTEDDRRMLYIGKTVLGRVVSRARTHGRNDIPLDDVEAKDMHDYMKRYEFNKPRRDVWLETIDKLDRVNKDVVRYWWCTRQKPYQVVYTDTQWTRVPANIFGNWSYIGATAGNLIIFDTSHYPKQEVTGQDEILDYLWALGCS